jgi:hypothetical protein
MDKVNIMVKIMVMFMVNGKIMVSTRSVRIMVNGKIVGIKVVMVEIVVKFMDKISKLKYDLVMFMGKIIK